MWELIAALLIGLGLMTYGLSCAYRQTTDGVGPWILLMLLGSAIAAIAAMLLLIMLAIHLATGS